ncbi:hypothetical protein LIER_22986 [Lithospermum erythrorhizon]|uniref:Uncharacterized protein n=1 Tax=Lithospermum erythrorhizon TaxID=34254 RepID=A0AAV3QW06_LITER
MSGNSGLAPAVTAYISLWMHGTWSRGLELSLAILVSPWTWSRNLGLAVDLISRNLGLIVDLISRSWSRCGLDLAILVSLWT